LGVAGVSLSLAGGASAMPVSGEVSQVIRNEETVLREFEIADVSLATFHFFDEESGATAKSAGTGTAGGAGAGAGTAPNRGRGCGGCGSCGNCGQCRTCRK
jgi:hypothetical protein